MEPRAFPSTRTDYLAMALAVGLIVLVGLAVAVLLVGLAVLAGL